MAFFLSQVTKSPYLGFLIVALMYFLIVLVLVLSRDSLKIQEKIQNVLKEFIFQMNNRQKEDE
jgi:hypothetical protein